MTTLNMLFALRLNLGLPEIIVFQIGAIILGFSIHFFWKSRYIKVPHQLNSTEATEWRSKYFEEVDIKDRLTQELAVLKKDYNHLEAELSIVENKLDTNSREEIESQPAADGDYLTQLARTQTLLYEHNNVIKGLSLHIEKTKSKEAELLRLQKVNDEQSEELIRLRTSHRDNQTLIYSLQEQLAVQVEISEKVEKSFVEFEQLHAELNLMKSELVNPPGSAFELDQVKQNASRLSIENDDLKLELISIAAENQKLNQLLSDAKGKLSEEIFQRQQLSRKLSFLEELNGNINSLNGHQKALEVQMKRISELRTSYTASTGVH